MQEDLEELYRDELTGVYNRRYLNLILERELARTRRYGDNLSILIIDLDNFKEINDTYGHLEGDRILIKFAWVLKESVRDADVIIRYGGDEFVIVAPSTGYSGAYTLAKRILTNISQINTPAGRLSASVGIATYPDHGTDFESLFEYADRCLYDAKHSGKGKIGVYKDANLAPTIPAQVFVGRKREKAYILQSLKVPEKIHIVSGDAGIGKTRLVKDTISMVGVKFAVGVAYGAITSIPYVVIRTLLLDLLKKIPTELKESFEKLSESSRYEIAKLVPQLLSREEIEKTSGDKFALFAGVSELFYELSRNETMVFLLDDLHWADKLSLELVYYLLHMALPNLVIFATLRNDEIAKTALESMLHILGRERLYDELELKEMSFSEVKMLTEAILKRIPSPMLSEKVYEFSGGNPFFVEEFIRTMYDRGHLYYKNGSWVLKEKNIIELSHSIKDTVERKLERLDERDLKVLRYAACAGREFYPDIIAGIVRMNAGEVFGILDRLVKNNILVEKEGGEVYLFKEDAIRLVVLNSMGEGRKRVMYNTIGEYIETNFGVNENNVEMVLHYFELARNMEKLIKYGELAGDRSFNVYAYDNAIKYYEYALSGALSPEKKGELYRKIGYAYLLMGRHKNALEHFKKALELLPEKRSELIGRFIAYTYNLMGDRERAISYYKKAIELTDNLSEKCGYMFMLAYHLVAMGKASEAESIAQQALSKLPPEPEEVRALGYNTLALIYQSYKDKEHSLLTEKYFKKALTIAEKGKVGKRNVAAFYNNLGGFYAAQGRYDEALKMFLEAKNIHEEINFAYGKALIYGNLATLYRNMGRYKEAIEYAEKGIKINNAIQKKHLNAPLYNIFAEMLYEKGDLVSAENVLRKSIEIAESNNMEEHELQAMALSLKIKLEKKEFEEAEKIAKKLRDFLIEKKMFVGIIFDTLMLYYETKKDKNSAKELLRFIKEQMYVPEKSPDGLAINVWELRMGEEKREYFEDVRAVMEALSHISLKDRAYLLYRIVEALVGINRALAEKYAVKLKELSEKLDLPRLERKIASLPV